MRMKTQLYKLLCLLLGLVIAALLVSWAHWMAGGHVPFEPSRNGVWAMEAMVFFLACTAFLVAEVLHVFQALTTAGEHLATMRIRNVLSLLVCLCASVAAYAVIARSMPEQSSTSAPTHQEQRKE